MKAHKEGNPFRVILEDKRSWQHNVSVFLQVHLKRLPVRDPFLVRNSAEVAAYFSDREPVKCISVDAKDLFYNIPQDEVVSAVEESIDCYGNIKFQSECGISVRDFLELLKLYLRSLFVCFQGHIYTQKAGICIGSNVAPVLSDIFLGKGNRKLTNALGQLGQ